MMKKAIIMLVFILLACVQPVWATPPSDIKLTYDLPSHTLTVDIAHVTQRLLDHYIRKIEIQVNDEPPIAQYLKRQDTPNGIKKEFAVTAKEGDIVTVKAYCQEGGAKEASLVVEKIKEPEAESNATELEEPATNEPAVSGNRY